MKNQMMKDYADEMNSVMNILFGVVKEMEEFEVGKNCTKTLREICSTLGKSCDRIREIQYECAVFRHGIEDLAKMAPEMELD